MELEKINGNEILKYLNDSVDEVDDLCDVSLCRPLEFESQGVVSDLTKGIDDKGFYRLTFSAYFNNWGTHQLVEDNYIEVFPNGEVRVWLEEAFEGDGSAEAIEDFLSPWLKTHEFSTNSEEEWMSIMRDAYEQLPQIGFNDPEGLQDQINILIKAKSYMK